MNLVPFLAVGENLQSGLFLGLLVVGAIVALAMIGVFAKFGMLWLQAYMSGAEVTMMSLIGMSFRQVNAQTIVTAQIMSRQSNLKLDKGQGLSTARLEAHFLAGGDVMHVMRAIIAANRAGIDLDFDRAAAIELAGRDVLDAVQTSVSPKVIDCPNPERSGKATLGAVARNGVELRVRARVTVRTNLDQLIGGATEETIIARIGQGIIAAIGSADSHMEVMETPDRISKGVLARGLDANTAFEIVSIDICDVDVGDNIGARLQSDQAEADMRMAKAHAEERRAVAVAHIQEMRAKVAANQSLVVQGEALVPAAMANAFRAGFMQVKKIPRPVKGGKPASTDLAG